MTVRLFLNARSEAGTGFSSILGMDCKVQALIRQTLGLGLRVMMEKERVDVGMNASRYLGGPSAVSARTCFGFFCASDMLLSVGNQFPSFGSLQSSPQCSRAIRLGRLRSVIAHRRRRNDRFLELVH